MHLLLVRHSEAGYNQEGRVLGQGDSLLTGEGHRQARQLAERLASWRVAAVYSSPLARAWETALAIAGPHGLMAQPGDGLQETAGEQLLLHRLNDRCHLVLPSSLR